MLLLKDKKTKEYFLKKLPEQTLYRTVSKDGEILLNTVWQGWNVFF